MDFTDKLAAIQYILALGEGVSITIEAVVAEPTPTVEPSAEPVVAQEPAAPLKEAVITLGNEEIVATLSEGEENVIVVEHYETVPNACGTGIVYVGGRRLTLNMCQMEGKTTVYLPTTINGNSNYRTAFSVKLATPEEPESVTIVNN